MWRLNNQNGGFSLKYDLTTNMKTKQRIQKKSLVLAVLESDGTEECC